MRSNSRCWLQAERGFILIELLTVVAIMAIVASIIMPDFMRARAQSQVAVSESNLRHLAFALESYYIERGTYPVGTGNASLPPDPEGVVYAAAGGGGGGGGNGNGGGNGGNGGGGGNGSGSGGVLSVLVPTYIQGIPLDPCTGSSYHYDSTNGTTYALTIDFPTGTVCDAIVGTIGDSVDLTYTPEGGLKEGP